MPKLDPKKQRWFAVEVVRQLRTHGHETYWAGGCVRDEVLRRTPKDYDVATSARPDEIRQVFGQRRTLAIGASFGVITVLGPPSAGQIEVATFRQDLGYSDGRHPDQVRFSSPREDALRRDFTINGMFFDPIEERVIDFVGGQDDLASRLIRAIGEPHARFTEDKLRMLRAVRFSAVFDFALEDQTAAAIRHMAPQISVVSAERIAAEMRLMLISQNRARAIDMLRKLGLLQEILPDVVVATASEGQATPASRSVGGDAGCAATGKWRFMLDALDALDEPTFDQALALFLGWPDAIADFAAVGARWRLSNRETEQTGWLLRNSRSLDDAAAQPWSELQPVLAHEDAAKLLELYRIGAALGFKSQADVVFCRAKLALPASELRPVPLIKGEDLIAIGVPKGKLYAKLLKLARRAQLDGVIQTADEARALVRTEWRKNSQ
jgi:tRNA nucleotidyltransferase/poly(A) polymerase